MRQFDEVELLLLPRGCLFSYNCTSWHVLFLLNHSNPPTINLLNFFIKHPFKEDFTISMMTHISEMHLRGPSAIEVPVNELLNRNDNIHNTVICSYTSVRAAVKEN